MLLSFFLGFFWPILFTPQNGQNDASPSASTPATGGAFNANAIAQGRVLELDNRMVLVCNGGNESVMQQFKQDLDSNPSLERVIGIPATGAFDLTLSKNASESEYASIASSFEAICPTGFANRRMLQVEFASAIVFNSTGDASAGAGSARLPPFICSQPNWNCFAFPSTKQNSTGSFRVSITRNAGASSAETGLMQQILDVNSTLPSTPSASPSASLTATATPTASASPSPSPGK